ncbi:MAG TPA: YeeE/YedE thiosulfate transporter family protein [Roseateles sp.]
MNPLAFVGAAACALLMGAAIQRGATCTVAAVGEVVEQRSTQRLRSLLEAALWVAAGLLLIRALALPLPPLPTRFALTGWTVLGAALLGLGAFVNQACVFGAIARLGNGEWAYAATPLGFYLGCASVGPLFGPVRPQALPGGTPLWLLPAALGLACAGWALWRAMAGWRQGGWWTPHVATVSIGLSFLALLLLQGPWAYTDALAELARGMGMQTARGSRCSPACWAAPCSAAGARGCGRRAGRRCAAASAAWPAAC